MSLPDLCNDDYQSPMGSPPGEDAFDEFIEKRDDNYVSPPSSEEDNGIEFDDYVNSLNLPSTEEPQGTRQTVRNMYVGRLKKATLMNEYPFVLKLYLAASSDAITMINWSLNGRQLVVDYQALQDHLTAGSPIFGLLSVTQFEKKMTAEGFVRRFDMEMMYPFKGIFKPMLIYYEQPEFIRGEQGALKKLMLDNLKQEKYSPMGKAAEEAEDEQAEKEPEFPPLHLPSKSHIERMQQRGDMCCSSISVRSLIEAARCHFRTLLDYLATSKVLRASDLLNKEPKMKNARPWDFPTFTSSSIKFVRPHDSVINLDANKPPPEYAGYYGDVSPSMVKDFFGDFLPRYGNKTTGYKDVVVETTTPKPNNFQQNLPIGLEDSDGEDNNPDDFQAPASPDGQDSDMDGMPSTSAAAMKRKRGAESVDDQDLEEAMQELCGGSTAFKDNVSSGSRGKAKAQSQPKTPKAPSRKRRAKSFESSSSEDDAEDSREPKRAKKDANGDDQERLSKSRGKAKAKTPKATSRKRLASSNKDEAGPPKKRAKKGAQESGKVKNKQMEELPEDEEEDFIVIKKRGRKKKPLPEADEETEEEDAEEYEGALQDEDENPEEEEYLDEEMAEEDEQPEEEYLEEEGDEEPEEAEQPEKDEQPEDKPHEDDEQPEKDKKSKEAQKAEVGKKIDEEENFKENEDAEENGDAKEDEEDKDEDDEDEDDEDEDDEDEDDEDEDAKEDEDDDDDDAEDNEEEDDDDEDYSVQYKAAPSEPEKPRRYHLRNSMRKSN